MSVHLLTSISCDEISLYLVDGFWWNLPQISTISVGIARKLFKVKGQKSRSWPDQLTYNGGGHTGTCHQTFSGTCFSSMALEPHERTNLSTRRYSTQCLQIINNNISYEEVCRSFNTTLWAERRLDLCQTLFMQIVRDNKTHVPHYLLAPKHDTGLSWPVDYDRRRHTR